MSLKHINPGDHFFMDQTFAFFKNKPGGIVDGLQECTYFRESPGTQGIKPPPLQDLIDHAVKGDVLPIAQNPDPSLKTQWNTPSAKPDLYPKLANADLHLTFVRTENGQNYIQGSLIRRPGEGVSCALNFVATERGLQVWHAMELQNPDADRSHLATLDKTLKELKDFRMLSAQTQASPSPASRLN